MHLLKHFKDLTVRPKNAQKLKDLVLQLAIQGKLTAKWREENPDIKPASELLKLIEKENTQLIKEKKLKKEKSLPPISGEEIPFNISQTWVWTRLGEIGTTNVGLTYKPANINDDGVPVLRSSNIQEGELCLKDLVRVNADYREKDIIKEGDLLICARNGSRRLVGKCTIIDQINEVMVFGAFMAIFRSDFNPYLQLFIQSPQYRSKLDGVETTTINQITQGNLKETTVPLPPLEEQKAIVEVVKTLFKEIEQLEKLTIERISLKEKFVTSALNQITTNNVKKEWAFLQEHFYSFFNESGNIKKLRETFLQLAVQGKLTAYWRANNSEIEDASVLLKRIQKEKNQLIKDKKIKKEKPLPPITKDEIPYELPEGWVWCRFQEVFDIRDGTHDSPKNVSGANSYPLVTSKDFNNGEIDFARAKRISKEDYNKIIQRSLVEVDDILFSMIGGNLGNQLMVKGNTDFAIKNVALFKYYNKSLSVPGFLKTFSEHIAHAVQEKASGGAQPFVSLTFLRNMLIPFPPFEEQKAIVKKVNSLMGLCDALKQQVLQSQEQSEQLMQSCLREIFESNLMIIK